MVNNLVGKVEGQAKEIKTLKTNQEEHCWVINTLTAQVIALEECVEDVQKKAFPQVGEGQLGIIDVTNILPLPDSCQASLSTS
jgi:hypothetical protein